MRPETQTLLDFVGSLRNNVERALTKEARDALKSLEQALPPFVEFMRGAKLSIGKTRVLRSNPREATSFTAMEREVCVQASLEFEGKKFNVSDVASLGGSLQMDSSYSWTGVVEYNLYPGLLRETWKMSNYFSNLFYSKELEDQFKKLFNEAGGENWRGILDQMAAEVLRVFRSKDEIVRESLVKTSGKERRALQKKFAKALQAATGLTDADPEAVLKFFKLGWEDIRLLSRFVKRNAADCLIIEVEDIVEAQNLAKVEKVMKS